MKHTPFALRSTKYLVASLAALMLWSAASAADAPVSGLDIAGMDTTVLPGNNFFKYANGKWLANTVIPEDRSSWGPAEELIELTDQRVSGLIKELGDGHAPNTDARKIADYYASFLDEAAIEAKGLKPITAKLDAIAAIKDRVALAHWLGTTIRADVDVLNATNMYTDNVLGLWVAQDLDNPARYLPFFLQGGLGMPDRDYYLSKAAEMEAIRDKYRSHVAQLLKLAGDTESVSEADAILALETQLATAHGSREEASDVTKGNNHWMRKDFKARAPGMDWDVFLAAAGLGREQEFVAWQPQAITGLAALVGSAPLDTWKAYLRYHVIEHGAPYLNKAIVAENFKFYGTTLSGTPVQRERWKRGVNVTNHALGEAVGKLYVERYFSPAAKARVQAIVQELLRAFAARIDGLTWMTPPTRTAAKAKLAALKVGVGYPDHWRDYSQLMVVRGDAYGNFERSEQFELQYALHKLGRPVDRSEWVMTPQTVNAVNLPAMNALNFPAAILSPPYFDLANANAANYGAIGATIGHEISHSFDNNGALFDASGRFRNWWSPKDLEQFHAATARLATQYDQYEPLPGLHLNGKQVLSENIADVAGLAVALDAYHGSLGGSPAPLVQGFTGDQQFFLAFAQSWRGKTRDAALRQQIITDGHSPNEQRALTVRNIPDWYTAFDVQAGQTYYLAPQDRVQIW